VNRKSVALDLAIELAGSAIVAAVVWLATLASQTIAIPTWAVITMAASVTAAVAVLVAFVVRARHVRRIESDLREAKESRQQAARTLHLIRNINRNLADQLIQGDEHALLKCATSYTVDVVGQDRIESV
jgi:membrane protein implicated in regulation of membrane protease activity